MQKDYINFREKGTLRQMEYLNPLIQQTKQISQSIDHFNEESRSEERKLEKLKAPITLNASSIRCTLPSNYYLLEQMTPLSFLIQYTKPSIHRQQIVLKLIRKIQFDTTITMDDAKTIVFEYFNQYRTYQDIDELFHFLNINSLNKFQPREIVVICCYAERYFLHKLIKTNRNILFERPLQERIDFEFVKRKFSELVLKNDLKQFMKTLEPPDK